MPPQTSIPVPASAAPKKQMDALAAQLANAIVGSKNKQVIVFDFVGTERKFDQLGELLAEDLNTTLGAQKMIRVQSRSRR
jgi:hypothetical protein